MIDSNSYYDAIPPREIAHKVEDLGVSKSKLNTLSIFVLALLAGAFISIGSILYIFVMTGNTLGFGPGRFVGGIAFSIGLIMVVIAGAELFTGNNLIAMAWASKKIKTKDVLRNWLISYVGNVAGSLGTACFVYWAKLDVMSQGMVGSTAINIAVGKINLSPSESFFRAVLCNALVCLAVWLTLGGRSVIDKYVVIIFPVAAFVTIGLEHSIANWFFFPYALLLDSGQTLDVTLMLNNILFVSFGNIFGGTVLVALVYWLAYLRPMNDNKLNNNVS